MITPIRSLSRQAVIWFSLGLFALGAAALRAGIGEIDARGWTLLAPSSDSVVIYVSSSTGDDAQDGRTPATAKRTIDAANRLLRDGFPDWMRLKRGDTFAEPQLGRWKSGRSAAEPMVLTTYGERGPRPLIRLTRELVDWSGEARNHVAFVGLDLHRAISDPDDPGFTNTDAGRAFRFIPGAHDAHNVLVEDCRLRYCTLVSQGSRLTEHFVHHMNVRRNIVMHSWAHGTTESHDRRPSGMFIAKTDGFVLEENLFHHHGWSEVIADANANQYNHNIYMSVTNTGEILVRGNILSQGSSHGVQLRSGGTAEMNAFVGNAIGMNLGYTTFPEFNTAPTYVRDNVFTDGRPQVPGDFTNPQTGAIWGLWKQLINDVHVDDNIVANLKDPRGGYVVPYQDMAPNEFGSGNVAWNWALDGVASAPDSAPIPSAAWSDPARDADAFAAMQGLPDFNAWVDRVAARPLHTMPLDLTAYSYVNYVRAGFGKRPVRGPYLYD